MKIYIVFGTTGEYSDHAEWPVVAYKDEEGAKNHALKATKRAKELEKQGWRDWHLPSDQEVNEFDPRMRIDYTGTKYYVSEVELND